MFSRFKNLLVFRLEQIMVRGPLWRLAVIMVLIGLVAFVGGHLARAIAPGFESAADAIWWAFLRLTDPGYLGDDEGVAKATVSTVITVLGYVLFMGSLIAIIVQWLVQTMDRLELGLTPVALDAHFVLVGWNSRTLTILEEILVSEGQVAHFLRRRGVRRLRMALLAERADASLRQQIKLELGEHLRPGQIILRSGSPLRLDDLARVDFAHASAILIPAADTTDVSNLDADTGTVKTVMTMRAALEEEPPEEPPLMVVEILDTRHVDTLRALYRNPMEIITGEEVIGRLVVQIVRRPGLSHVYEEFLSDATGNQIFVREEPQLVGLSAQTLTYAFPKGVLLGLVRPQGDKFRALLNPPNDLLVEEGDRIVVLAPTHEDAVPPETVIPEVDLPERPAPEYDMPTRRRVLVLGWHNRMPALLDEFASYPEEEFAIDIVSVVSAAKREKRIAGAAISTERLELRQLEFDYTVPADLETVDPASYDNVVLVASDRHKSGAESDARTFMGYLLLRELIQDGQETPPMLVELADPDDAPLFESGHGEVIVSPVIVSRMMARVALRRELRAVFDELFTSGGSEILFRRIADYDIGGSPTKIADPDTGGHELTFGDLQRAADARGEIAIGIRRPGQHAAPGGGVLLNPGRDESLQLGENDELIVLTTYQSV